MQAEGVEAGEGGVIEIEGTWGEDEEYGVKRGLFAVGYSAAMLVEILTRC